MSFFVSRVLPIGFAIGFGIWNGYYAFNPVFKEQMERKNDPALNVGQTGKQQQPQQPASTTSNST
ncbi:hypothetical protein MN608_09711 [Microdochium nivale]|nr:hypothetical protein MN608_09711 [Microdochium nivale]